MAKDIETIRELGDPNYKQHNPAFADGLDGLIETLEQMNAPRPVPIEFERIISDGDCVMTLRRINLSSEGPFQEKGAKSDDSLALVDIFRVHDGKVVEHWDYRERFPRPGIVPKHNNGPF